ncbi:hypothetical protein [Peterkaempfera bronchialis]|uniref:hypothetical protein n=1 Tax=Peterkaempfera bronchialis TaxID=2126346 RepID=UPI003C2D1DC8
MDAKDVHPAAEWPLPPPWMWACPECTALYTAMRRVAEEVEAAWAAAEPGLDCDPASSVVGGEIRLARHIATAHAPQVPDADPACAMCRYHGTGRSPALLDLEHRARHLFTPPSTAGLI